MQYYFFYRYGIVVFNVPLDTLYVISETNFLYRIRVRLRVRVMVMVRVRVRVRQLLKWNIRGERTVRQLWAPNR